MDSLSDGWDFELEHSIQEQQSASSLFEPPLDAEGQVEEGTVCIRESEQNARPRVPSDWHAKDLLSSAPGHRPQDRPPRPPEPQPAQTKFERPSIIGDAHPWLEIFGGDLISGSDIRSLVSELGGDDESFVPEENTSPDSFDLHADRMEPGKLSMHVDGSGSILPTTDDVQSPYPANIDDVELLTEESGSVRQSTLPALNRSGNLRTIRPMNGTSLSAMMMKLGNDCNMRFNEEKRCWEGSDEQLILEDEAAALNHQPRDAMRRSKDNLFYPEESTHSIRSSNAAPPGRESGNGFLFNKKDESRDDAESRFTPRHSSVLQELPLVSPPEAFHEVPPSAESLSQHDRSQHRTNGSGPGLRGIMHSFGIKEGSRKDIEELSLQGCGLASVSSLGDFVRGLDRSNNQLTYLDGIPESISVLFVKSNRHCLKSINLAGNQIETLENLEGFESLTEVDLSRNNISRIRIQSVIPSLKKLNLRGNSIESIQLDHFSGLEQLDLCENSVASVSGASPLLELDLSAQNTYRSSFTSIHSKGVSISTLSHFRGLYSLQSLDASSCNLTEIDEEFAGFVGSSLKILRVSDNKITTLRHLDRMRKLEELYAADNSVMDFAVTIMVLGRVERLKVVDLSLGTDEMSFSRNLQNFRFNPITAKFYPSQKPLEPEVVWAKRDAIFRSSLTDSDFVKRACYRSTLIAHHGHTLISLDNLEITERDRQRSVRYIRKVKEAVKRGPHPSPPLK
ncbi:hypothetical protein HDU67_006480 [Dinochytrium kinnereticum]|nr:hypothetical protein HDU67_006480 [Dinochytrium kinnereticum]